jgi:ATP/maltotriose-dependent transcriptional regulator MalT
MSKRDAFIEKMKHQLDEINEEIGELESKAAAGREKLGKTYDAQVASLQASAAGLRAKIDELMAAGDEKWDALVAEADKVQKALVQSFNYFKSQLK